LETYLTSTAPSSVSYLGFLKSARHIIVKSPPLTEDWKGLNGAWYRRFSKATKKLNLLSVAEEAHFPSPSDNEEHLLTAIYLNPEYRHIFLVLIICDMVYSVMLWGEDVGDEIVDECQRSSKRLKKDKQGQSRLRSGVDYHSSSKDNVESQGPVSVFEYDDSEKSDFDTQEAIDGQDQEEVKDAISGEEAKKVGPFRLSKENREEIDAAFKSMDERCMWKLSTGRFVEKELYKLGQEQEFEQLVFMHKLYVDDELISSYFSDTELDEIDYAAGPHVPDLPDQIAEFLYEFAGKTNLNEIRETIKSKMFGNNYDHEKHHDKDYIIYALYS
ncbi:15989_t:CDS:2, partial [Acaulospora colombiana]